VVSKLIYFLPFAAGLAFSGEPVLTQISKGDFTPPRALESVRVVDWNIDRGTRLEQISAVLERERPDLCLLQEVDRFDRRSGNQDVAKDLAHRLNLNYVFGPSWQELSQGSAERPAIQGQAILTRLPLRNVRILKFRRQSGWWQPRPYIPNMPIMQRRLGGRIALVAELEMQGRLLVVYDVHLESRSLGSLQSEQMDEILADSRRYPAGTSILLGGDFNTKYNAGAFLRKLDGDGWRNAFGDRTPRTHAIFGNLDWIVTRGPIETRDARVVRGSRGSDHFPVAALLSAH